MEERFYKGKYLICVYDQNETLIGTYDNHSQFRKDYQHLNDNQHCTSSKNKTSATHSILSRISLGKRKSFFSNGQRLFIEFVDMGEE